MSDLKVAGRTDIDSVLREMRAMKAAAGGELNRIMSGADAAPGSVQAPRESTPGQPAGFGTLLKNAVDSVNELSKDSGARAAAVASGQSRDLVGAMIASEKSGVAFQALLQVRNRAVSAYQDIMNMPI